MSAAKPVVCELVSCARPALVKVRVDKAPELAILGIVKSAPEIWLAFVLGRFEMRNWSGAGGLQMNLENEGALNFGKEFSIVPDYAGRVQIDSGDLFKTPGALISVKDDELIVFSSADPKAPGLKYLSLTEMRSSGERSAPRIAFASWSLTLKGADKPLFTHAVPDANE
jgi:hypothetical protein